jgi:hypothetical protein
MAGYPDAAAAQGVAAPVPAGAPPEEKSPAELAKMTKEERTAYHMARRAAGVGAKPAAAKAGEAAENSTGQLTKAQRRAIQDSQRKVKEDKANAGKDTDELFSELKLQGLSEDQARSVMAAIKADEPIEGEDDDDDDGEEDLLSSVRNWMKEQPDGEIPTDIADFNMKVRFQGHVDTTPPDHFGAMLQVLVPEALSKCDLAAAKVSPGAIAKALTSLLERWAHILRALYSKIPDVLEGVGVLVQTISQCVEATDAPEAGKDCAVVGCLMAIRDVDDMVEDDDLLVGCKTVEPRSPVLEKYINFLEDAVAEDDEDDEDSD